jgi:hypothetical protein
MVVAEAHRGFASFSAPFSIIFHIPARLTSVAASEFDLWPKLAAANRSVAAAADLSPVGSRRRVKGVLEK